MDIYIDILKNLADNDNGQFIDVSVLHADFSFLYDKTRELEKAGHIRIKSTATYVFGDRNGNIQRYGDESNLKKIEAKILLSGHEYLNKLQADQNKKNSLIGNNSNGNTIIISKENSSIEKVKIDNSSTTSSEKSKEKNITNILKQWWWAFLIPIIAGIIILIIEHNYFP